MKKIFFLCIAIVYTTATFGQKTIALHASANIELPSSVEKITREQAVAFASNKFDNDKILLDALSRRKAENMYKVDDILVSLFDNDKPVNTDHLIRMKKGMDEMLKTNATYKSSIQNVNRNSIFVMNYIMGKVEYYRFFSYNSKFSRAVTGILEFDKGDENKASAILTNIFNSLSIKE